MGYSQRSRASRHARAITHNQSDSENFRATSPPPPTTVSPTKTILMQIAAGLLVVYITTAMMMAIIIKTFTPERLSSSPDLADADGHEKALPDPRQQNSISE